jgi:hypothetical protein
MYDLKPNRQRRDLHKLNLLVTSWNIGTVFIKSPSDLRKLHVYIVH